ncbi:MAG: hypothetical protein C6I01_04580 [Epsilonproteobacteria bacterium]|jgi:hypothetical protein|nr:hypothetical protein [Campylobacterota bacterium]NPA89760.1 hypothetical protein [Campylobacterota bacterium]
MDINKLFLEEQVYEEFYFNEEDVELYRKLKEILEPYIEMMNFRRFETNLNYSLILIYSIPQIYDLSRERLSKREMLVRINENFFIVISQGSRMEEAIQIGSHILSSFNREIFMLGQSLNKSKVSVISIEHTKEIDVKILSYKIVETLKEMLKDDRNTWVKMVKL